jgi:Ser/Thr protein kinase RdoA (MazF antagonist)
MARGGAHFSSEELVRVLSHYDVGVVHRVRPLEAGNRRAAKVVIKADRGTFLLKRRPRGADDLAAVEFAHAVQRHLAAKSFPIPRLLETSSEGRTLLSLDEHIYEFFHFVEGFRYDGSPGATAEAGRQLAVFHRHLRDFHATGGPTEGCFHDDPVVREHLEGLASEKGTDPARRMRAVAEALLLRYNKSSVRVNTVGFPSWKRQVIHGDWHPGNLLFMDRQVVAVVDFDSIRISPAVTDLANGLLQFSIIGDRPDPAEWPDHFREDRLFAFLEGYEEVTLPSERKRYGLVDLMIETMIAEAVLPVAATGFFGRHSGLEFLEMILRKTKWLRLHRRELRKRMLGRT